jgi:4'-phosphopantetheinyl transferase
VTTPPGPWRLPSRLPALPAGTAQVWSVDLDVSRVDAKRLEAVLCEAERRRAARYRRAQDRRRFIAARATLRCLLAAHLDAEPRTLAFAYGANGKPALTTDGLRFNLSHSGDLAAIALARDRAVGVDLEYVRPLSSAQRIAERLWSSDETAALGALDDGGRLTAFFATWTRKEAVVKALGEGITGRLDGFQVPTQAAPTSATLDISGAAWWIADLRPAPGYLGTLAVPGTEIPVSCWRWPPQWSIHAGSQRRYRAAPGTVLAARSANR